MIKTKYLKTNIKSLSINKLNSYILNCLSLANDYGFSSFTAILNDDILYFYGNGYYYKDIKEKKLIGLKSSKYSNFMNKFNC